MSVKESNYNDNTGPAEKMSDLLTVAQVEISGNLAGDVDFRETDTGTKVASVYFAASKVGRQVEEGEKRDKTTRFVNVTVWEDRVDDLAKFSKGDAVLFKGYMKPGSTYVDKDGNEKKGNVEFVASYVTTPFWARGGETSDDGSLD